MSSSQEMLLLVDKFLSSGQTQTEFCREAAIKSSTFSYWVRKVRNQNSDLTAGGFARVVVNKNPSCSSELEINYPNGVMMKVPSTDLSLISALIRVY
jgi:transposase-like protein